MRRHVSAVILILVVIAATSCGGDTSDAGRQPTTTPTMETIDGVEVDLSLLPEELQPLAPLIRKYAASDDVVRTDRLDAASSEELRDLVGAMTTERWDAYEAFSDAHLEEPGTPEQDVALVLSSFAEAVAEAAVTLDEREGSS